MMKEMSHVMRKPIMWFPNKSGTNLAVKHRRWLQVENFGWKKQWICTIGVVKTKALISFTVTAMLICAFVFLLCKMLVFS